MNNINDIELLKQERKIKRANYLKQYKADRKKDVKELNVTLSIKEFNNLKKEARKYGTTPNQLILTQALAYKEDNYLVPETI
jgi:hypothetical protein